MKKKVLIITYYWPPSGGSGVQRWLKFAKYLPEFGWQPTIFTPKNPDFNLQDPSLEKEISEDIQVIKRPIWEPYSILRWIKGKKDYEPTKILEKKEKSILEKLSIWLRANFLIPDPRVFWVNPSVSYLVKLTKTEQFNAIITTGPPHSVHLIGLKLKEKTGVFWVADFRDPWSDWEFLDTLPMSSFSRKKHQKLELSVLSNADRVLTISPTFQRNLSKLAKRPIELITNGFDSSDIPHDFKSKTTNKHVFHIVYTGVIDAIRNPIPFLKVLKATFEKTGQKIKLSFVGRVSKKVIEYTDGDKWLSEIVHYPGYVSHQEVFKYYAEADLLLLILTETKNAKGNIPGKLFEYLATGITILGIGDPMGDTAGIIKENEAGTVIAHHESRAIEDFLCNQINIGIEDKRIKPVSQYSRKSLTQKLTKLLDEGTLS